MGLRASQKEINSGIRKALRNIDKELTKSDVRHVLDSRNFYIAGYKTDKNFKISYRILFASNGETAALPQISINNGGGVENFNHLGYNQGMKRIVELFGAENGNPQ